MLTTKYCDGSEVKAFDCNGVIALAGEEITGILEAKPRCHGLIIVEDYVQCADVWQGERLPERLWSPGDIAFLPAHSEFRSTPDRPYRENALSLDSELLIARGRAYLETYNIETHFADITCDEITPVARLLHQLVSSNECKAWPLMTDSLVLALTVSIVRKFSPKAEQTRIEMNKSGLNNARTKRVVEFVEANIGNAIRLEDMAAAAALSPYHFTRSFKQAMGMSPTRFVLEQRIRDAQIRLRTTATSLAAIAHDCGFASQSHFTSAFKAAVGITPALFRATVMS